MSHPPGGAMRIDRQDRFGGCQGVQRLNVEATGVHSPAQPRRGAPSTRRQRRAGRPRWQGFSRAGTGRRSSSPVSLRRRRFGPEVDDPITVAPIAPASGIDVIDTMIGFPTRTSSTTSSEPTQGRRVDRLRIPRRVHVQERAEGALRQRRRRSRSPSARWTASASSTA